MTARRFAMSICGGRTIHDVGFKDAHLVESDLSQAVLFACYFRQTHFQQCNLVNAKFEKSDFSGARVEDSRLDFTSFKECEMTLQTIRFRPDTAPKVLARVCRNLKLNAMTMGHFSDAGELTYMEKSHERRELYRQAFANQHECRGERMKTVFAWMKSAFLNWLWGYGEKPQRLTLVMVIAIGLFGVLQYWLDGIPGNSFGAHLYFSGITFLTIGYGDLVPVAPLPRFFAVVEGAVGITVLGMLIASWTKKIMYR